MYLLGSLLVSSVDACLCVDLFYYERKSVLSKVWFYVVKYFDVCTSNGSIEML